jgi:hypothetical protein
VPISIAGVSQRVPVRTGTRPRYGRPTRSVGGASGSSTQAVAPGDVRASAAGAAIEAIQIETGGEQRRLEPANA